MVEQRLCNPQVRSSNLLLGSSSVGILRSVMRHAFYDSEEYRSRQSDATRRRQESGAYEHLKKQEQRICERTGCGQSFTVQQADPKRFCGTRCSILVTNTGRRLTGAVKQRISASLKGNTNTRGSVRFEPLSKNCENVACGKSFSYPRYKSRKFCSVPCAMKITGSQATSSRASRGKAGVRTDVHPSAYFYSRWEANIARLYTYLGIRWVFEPKSFDIGNQRYTPDFYLPDFDVYIEVKNFWGEYSRRRDEKFRSCYPNISLQVILKNEYRILENQYAHLIPTWEYKNTPFISEVPGTL